MGGQWKHRREAAAHRRAREAYFRQVIWGVTPCCRCGQPLTPPAQLDHSDSGDGYLGVSHKACNAAAGGVKAALNAGRRLRQRQCAVCGVAFVASRSSDGARAQTCGRAPCVAKLKASRRAREPDPQTPPASGRRW